VEIPEDQSLLLNLTTANTKLEKYHVPEEEIRALLHG
jgi:hypothetical protein